MSISCFVYFLCLNLSVWVWECGFSLSLKPRDDVKLSVSHFGGRCEPRDWSVFAFRWFIICRASFRRREEYERTQEIDKVRCDGIKEAGGQLYLHIVWSMYCVRLSGPANPTTFTESPERKRFAAINLRAPAWIWQIYLQGVPKFKDDPWRGERWYHFWTEIPNML